MPEPVFLWKAYKDPLAKENIRDLFTCQRWEYDGDVHSQGTGEIRRGAEPGFRVYGSPHSTPELKRRVRICASSDLHVLVTGETGTGKERVIQEIARLAEIDNLAPVNCAQFSEGLPASELFGHVKGAFPGAVRDKKGLLEEVQGGALLLDKLDAMPQHLQALLLRAIEQYEIKPVGSERNKPIKPFRLFATSNDPGAIRPDIKQRFHEHIHIPPLRDRITDAFFILEGILEEHQKTQEVPSGAEWRLTAETLVRMLYSPWPGNVRELRNAAERAFVRYRAASGGSDQLQNNCVLFSYCPAINASEKLHDREAAKRIYAALKDKVLAVNGSASYFTKDRLDVPLGVVRYERLSEDEEEWGLHMLLDLGAWVKQRGSSPFTDNLLFSNAEAIQFVCLLARHHLQAQGLLDHSALSFAPPGLTTPLRHFDDYKAEVLQLPPDESSAGKSDVEEKPTPDPAVATTLTVWTDLKDGTFHILAKTNGIRDGEEVFPLKYQGRDVKQTQFLQLLCRAPLKPVALGEVIQEVYPEDLEKLNSGDTSAADDLGKKIRALAKEVRDKLSKCGIDPAVLPIPTTDQISKKTPQEIRCIQYAFSVRELVNRDLERTQDTQSRHRIPLDDKRDGYDPWNKVFNDLDNPSQWTCLNVSPARLPETQIMSPANAHRHLLISAYPM